MTKVITGKRQLPADMVVLPIVNCLRLYGSQHGSRVAAINATGGMDTFKGVLGTLIVKVFDMNVGKAGR